MTLKDHLNIKYDLLATGGFQTLFLYQRQIDKILQRLKSTIPNIKLLLVVRNPVKRIVSNIVHEFKDGKLKNLKMPNIDDLILQRSETGVVHPNISGNENF